MTLLGLVKQDLRMMRRDLLVNRLLASALTPRTARLAVLRALRYPIEGLMLPGVTIVGPLRNLRTGAGSSIGRRCFLDVSAPVSIGERTALAVDTVIVTSDHPIDESGRWSESPVPQPISIGDRVWLGARVVVCPGAVIESDVVVAAGAVVVGRLEAGGVYGGVPARRLGTRVVTGCTSPPSPPRGR